MNETELLDAVKLAKTWPAKRRRRVREAAELSIRDIAEAIDVRPQTLASWEDASARKLALRQDYQAYLQLLQKIDQVLNETTQSNG